MFSNKRGFSLIELLLVVTIVGIIAVIAIPYLIKAVGASENSNAFASLKTISLSQVTYFSRKNRFARLDELNADTNNALGTTQGNNLIRGVFTLTMSPVTPTDAELSTDYQIIATKGVTLSNTPCVLSLDGSGAITELFGTSCVDND